MIIGSLLSEDDWVFLNKDDDLIFLNEDDNTLTESLGLSFVRMMI